MSTSGVHKCHRLLRVPPAGCSLVPEASARVDAARGCPCPGSRRLIPLRSRDGEAEESPSERSPGWAQRASRDGAWAAPSGGAHRLKTCATWRRGMGSPERRGTQVENLCHVATVWAAPSGDADAIPIAYAIGLPDGASVRRRGMVSPERRERADHVSQRRGLSTTVARGGSVSDSDHSRPWLGRGSAAIAPALPRLPPPYQAESPLKISS
jgi:hypothetical protein